MTEKEHQAVRMAADLYNLLHDIVGTDLSREADMKELATHIHAIQNAVLAQAAARAYPSKYRLLGRSPSP